MSFENPKVPPIEKEKKEIECVITAKGSVYNYLPDGTTQRFKKAENKEYEPQAAIVFVPDYETIKKIAPKDLDVESVFGENDAQYNQILLEKNQTKGSKNYIVNAQGKKLETNEAIQAENGPIFLTFGSEDKVDFFIPVSKEPKIGYYTFDTRKYTNENGEFLRERHIGNKVTEIRYK